jgi:hypothetical protein
MSDSTVENKSGCISLCEKQFVKCTRSMPSGCVEDLRVCRESCRLEQSS